MVLQGSASTLRRLQRLSQYCRSPAGHNSSETPKPAKRRSLRVLDIRKNCRKPGSVTSDQPERAPGEGCRASERPIRQRQASLLRPYVYCRVLLGRAPEGFTKNKVTIVPSALLHHGSTLACAAYAAIGGPFLWHFPSARADWTLSSILPYGTRTVLPSRTCLKRCKKNSDLYVGAVSKVMTMTEG
jgi:hypothetical protein